MNSRGILGVAKLQLGGYHQGSRSCPEKRAAFGNAISRASFRFAGGKSGDLAFHCDWSGQSQSGAWRSGAKGGSTGSNLAFGARVAMNLSGEPPEKWLVDTNPRLNDVHQRVPNQNSYPCHGRWAQQHLLGLIHVAGYVVACMPNLERAALL